MGRSKYGKGSKGQQFGGRRKENEDEPRHAEELRPVDGRWHLTKASLRPYASSSGSPFFAGKQQSDTDFLSLSSVASAQETWTSEICNRPGIALSEGGSTIGMGQTLLLAYATESSAAGEKLGVQGRRGDAAGRGTARSSWRQPLSSTSADDAPKTPAALQTAAKDWVRFFNTDTKSKAKRLQRMVKTAATSYLFGMELLQWLAAMEHRDEWAAKMKSVKGLQKKLPNERRLLWSFMSHSVS